MQIYKHIASSSVWKSPNVSTWKTRSRGNIFDDYDNEHSLDPPHLTLITEPLKGHCVTHAYSGPNPTTGERHRWVPTWGLMHSKPRGSHHWPWPYPFSHFPENLFLSALSALLVLLYVIWISDVKMLRNLCLENQDQVWKASLTIHLSAWKSRPTLKSQQYLNLELCLAN